MAPETRRRKRHPALAAAPRREAPSCGPDERPRLREAPTSGPDKGPDTDEAAPPTGRWGVVPNVEYDVCKLYRSVIESVSKSGDKKFL